VPKSFAKYVRGIETCLITSECIKNLKPLSPAELFTDVGLTPSRAEAKRLIKQGGLTVNDERIDSLERMLTTKDLGPEGLVLKAGKKKFHRVVPG
jgi:tyrosyl-tRNA synthetase